MSPSATTSPAKNEAGHALAWRARTLLDRVAPVTRRERSACLEVVPALQSMLDEAQQLCVQSRRIAACVGRAQSLAGRLADHSVTLNRLRAAVTTPKAPRREVLGQLARLASQLRECIREANSMLDEEHTRNPLMGASTIELIALGRARRHRSSQMRAPGQSAGGFGG